MKRVRRPTEKLINELRELRESRESIDSYYFNFLRNYYEICKFMHLQIKNNINKVLLVVAYRQYFVFLVSCWETYFRDVFILVYTKDENLMERLLDESKSSEKHISSKPTDIEASDLLSKSFNFQNIDDLNSAFSNLVGTDFIEYICKSKIPSCGIKGRRVVDFSIESVFTDWDKIIKIAFDIRHKVVHDANYRIEFDSTLIQKVESLFLLIPQIATHFIAKKFSLKSIVMIDDGMNVGTALFTVDEILSENWELVF